MNGMARVLKAQGDDAGAIKIWQEMVAKIPGTHAGTAGLAEAYLEQEEFQKAIPLLEQLAKENPEDASWQKKLAPRQDRRSQVMGMPRISPAAWADRSSSQKIEVP